MLAALSENSALFAWSLPLLAITLLFGVYFSVKIGDRNDLR
ncbi:hypothetical protein [Roseibium sp. M-1]